MPMNNKLVRAICPPVAPMVAQGRWLQDASAQSLPHDPGVPPAFGGDYANDWALVNRKLR